MTINHYFMYSHLIYVIMLLYISILQANAESSKVVDIKTRIVDSVDKTKSWKFSKVVDSTHLKSLRLPDPVASSKLLRLGSNIHFLQWRKIKKRWGREIIWLH